MLHTLLAKNISSGLVNPHFGSQKWSKCPFLATTLTKYIEKLKLVMQTSFYSHTRYAEIRFIHY